MAQEHQEYIQTKVNPTLENLVTQVLLERPEAPVPFMIRWLATQQSGQGASVAAPQISGPSETDRLRGEVQALQQEVRQLEVQLGKNTEPLPRGASPQQEDSEEEGDDDEMHQAQIMKHLKSGQRNSVSAEAYGDWNQLKAYTPVVVPKSEKQKEKLLEVLRSCILFATLDGGSLDIIVNAMAERRVDSGERIINEGDTGDFMFVVEQGAFDCLKRVDNREDVLHHCIAGDYFGELALLYNCPRAASVVAREASVAWQLDRETFNHIVREAAMTRRQKYEEFLSQVPILAELGQYERAQLSDAFRTQLVTAGTTVLRQGEDGALFYLVEDGELVAMKSEGGQEREVFSYHRGGYFGELALLGGSHDRAATVMARTDAKLLWVDRTMFERLLGPLKNVLEQRAHEYK